MTRHAPRFLSATVLGLLACAPAPLSNNNNTPADAATDAVSPADQPPGADVVALPDAPLDPDAAVSPDAPMQPDIPILTDVPEDAMRPCMRPADCAAPFGVCELGAHRCVQCLSAAQCGSGQVCVANRCQPSASCMTSRTCSGLVCDTARMVCVECLGDVDCPMGQVCRAQSCAAPPTRCTSSRQCSMFDQVCHIARGICVECETDVDCPMGSLCSPESTCRPQACAPNSTMCLSPTRMRACDARGAALTERDCGTNETCAMGRCQARICAPGAASCASSTQVQTCTMDGLGYTPGATCPTGQTCSQGACSACDGDGDGDDDGISDASERAVGTNPCARDSDGDGATDLVENLAGTNPLVRGSVPPGIFVDLPYNPGGTGAENREITVNATRRALDVFFVVDTTGSMQPTITALQSNAGMITSTITSTAGAGADLRFSVADFRDFGTEAMAQSSDYAMRVQSPLNADAGAFERGLARLTLGNGGDAAEALVPAMHALVDGSGFPAYLGTATRAATTADCGGDVRGIGWGCYFGDRLPVFVVYSDAAWHNPPGQSGNFYRTSAPNAPVYGDLVRAMRRRNARYLGVDVGSISAHLTPSISLARDTDSFESTGAPTAYAGNVTGTLARVAANLAGLTAPGRPDYLARGAADPTATGLPTGRSSGDFIRTVNAVRGTPDMPAGFSRREAGTFYGAAQGATLTYNAVLLNDFVPQGASDQAFPAAVVITAGGYPIDRRMVWVVVPGR